MSRPRRLALGIAITVLLLLVGGVVYARPLLVTGTGYAAHNACAITFLTDRGTDAHPDDLPDNPLVPLLRTDVDVSEARATSSVLGLFTQTAWLSDGLGCTLAEDRPDIASPAAVTAAAWPTPDGGSGPARGEIAAVEAAVDAAFAETRPGGESLGTRAVVVVYEGHLIVERYADGFDADTRQLGWSMAKSVTNAMVGRLIRDGVLEGVDEPAGLAAWDGDDRAVITFDNLLHMASGLQWDETYALGTTITEMLYAAEDMGAFAASQPLSEPVGTFQQYSSGTTNIICDAIAERVDVPASTMAHELVFEPLGMTSAVLEPDASGGPVCSSYLWATPRDWARFGQWFLSDGVWEGERLLPEGWVDYSTAVPDLEVFPDDDGHAAHWWANELPGGSLRFPMMPADTFWASGHDGQRVMIVPSTELVVVRMGFSPDIAGDELGIDRLVADVIAALG